MKYLVFAWLLDYCVGPVLGLGDEVHGFAFLIRSKRVFGADVTVGIHIILGNYKSIIICSKASTQLIYPEYKASKCH
jgi:hypothetical protein